MMLLAIGLSLLQRTRQRRLQRRLLMFLKGPDNPQKLPLPVGGSPPPFNTRFLGPIRVFVQNGMSISSAVFAQLNVECPITLQCAATFSLQNCSFPLRDRVPHLTHVLTSYPSHHPKRHLDRFSLFCMGPECYTVQCIVSGEETAKIVPFSWDCVTLPEEDQATAIGNMHRRIGKDCACGTSSQTDRHTDRQTDRHTHTDILITILCHRSHGRSKRNSPI